MIYINKENQVFYYTAQPVGEFYYDLYNFTSMNRNDEAVQAIIDWSVGVFGLSGNQPKKETRYVLVLDFLANSRVEPMTKVIDRVIKYFEKHGFKAHVTEVPLRVRFENLKIEDVLNIIQDNEFQAINCAVSALSCSVWRLSIQ